VLICPAQCKCFGTTLRGTNTDKWLFLTLLFQDLSWHERAPACVCYFVLFKPYWGIVTFPGFQYERAKRDTPTIRDRRRPSWPCPPMDNLGWPDPRVSRSSLKIELLKSISSIQASKSQKRDFRDFFQTKVCSSYRNVRFKNFMHSEWREEKFLKGIVGHKMGLHFRNKHQKIDLVFMQLARYGERMQEFWSINIHYQEIWLINKMLVVSKMIFKFSC